MTEDTLTARNRINQRNFRARRQNYIRDLEERLRKYELEGVQATIEIQTAARQVTEQNVKLRSLLSSRFGMLDPEIDAYLDSTAPSLTMQANLFAVPPGAAKSFLDASAKTRPLMASHPNTYIPGNPTQLMPSSTSVLSPALGLASLHKLPEAVSPSEPPTKKLRRDYYKSVSVASLASEQSSHGQPAIIHHSSSASADILPTQSQRRDHEQDPDTLSESSNPQTPAGQYQSSVSDQSRSLHNGTDKYSLSGPHHAYPALISQPPSLQTDVSSASSTTTPNAAQTPTSSGFPFKPQGKTLTLKGDETTCEDAARIIASMRGGSDRPEHILMELGCTPSSMVTSTTNGGRGPDTVGGSFDSKYRAAECKVKNLSIFSLMDQ